MHKDQLANQWQQLKGQIKQKWNKLTDNDLNQINGKYDALCNCIQKAYNCKRDQAEKQINEFKPELTSKTQTPSASAPASNQGQQRPGQPNQGKNQGHGQPAHHQQQQNKDKGSEQQREKVRL